MFRRPETLNLQGTLRIDNGSTVSGSASHSFKAVVPAATHSQSPIQKLPSELMLAATLVGQAQTGPARPAAFALPLLLQLDPIQIATPPGFGAQRPTRGLALQVSSPSTYGVEASHAPGAAFLGPIYGRRFP